MLDEDIMSEVTRKRLKRCSSSTCIRWYGYIFDSIGSGSATRHWQGHDHFNLVHIRVKNGPMLVLAGEETEWILKNLKPIHKNFAKYTDKMKTKTDQVVMEAILRILGNGFVFTMREIGFQDGLRTGIQQNQHQMRKALGIR